MKEHINTAFTLIELLVVIAIIGILASISIPMIANFRADARKTSCINTLRQIGVAIHAYANSNNGLLPTAVRMGETIDDPAAIQNIVKIPQKTGWKCAADFEAVVLQKTCFDSFGNSYEWNTWANGRPIDKSALQLSHLFIEIPLLGDAYKYHGQRGQNYLYSDGSIERSLEVRIE